MLPPFYLGAYPATDIDYGLFDLSELEHARKTLLLILKKVDEGKRARVAVDLLRQRVADNFRPRNTEEEEFHKLTSSLRYGYLLGSKADAKIDLSWVPIPVFLGLVEHLSSQPLTALSMSRKATYLAFASLWSRPLNRKVQERYYHYLCKEHPPWAQKFREELQSIPEQVITSSIIQAPSIQLNLSTKPTTTFRTQVSAISGYEINSKLPKDLGRRDRTGTNYNFITMVTGPSTFCRSISSASDSIQSLREPAEKFLRVKNDFPFAATLLMISAIWGGKALPRMMYARATVPRKRWNSQGEVEEVHLEPDLGFQASETTAAIEYLCSSNLLTLDSNVDGYEKLSVDTSLQQYLEQQLQDSEQMKIRALMLMCHLFPGDKEIEPFQHKDLGRLQLEPFQCVEAYIQELLKKNLLSHRQQHDIIATLLESSNFSDSTWKFHALSIAEEMLVTTPDESLEMYAAIRRKALSRLVLGKTYEEPCGLLERPITSSRSNFLHWKLRLSRAQDCIHRDDFAGARREASQYAAVNPTKPSTLEWRFGKEIRFEHARFVYLAGDFPEAKSLLEQELQAINHDRGEKLYDSLISYLAGVRCELGNPAEAVRLARSALTGPHDREGHSRLHVSLAEAVLHLGMSTCTFDPSPSMDENAQTRFSEARDICERVIHRYQSSSNFDIVNEHDKMAKVDRINYLRVTTIVARISLLEAIFGRGDLSQALCDWVAVSEAIKLCGWAKPGFMEGISHLTIGAIEMCRGETTASERDVKVALSLLNAAGRRHLIVGLGVIWPEFTERLRCRNGGRPAVELNAELSI